MYWRPVYRKLVVKVRFAGRNREIHCRGLVLLPSSTYGIGSPHAPKSVALAKHSELNLTREIATPVAACELHNAIPTNAFGDDVLVTKLVGVGVAIDTSVHVDA
ncbi:MAG: hypothetical protein NPIRA03_37240 [Nitrospirales bacterium]|nr:MAG: hypothetical protein NPIRA03_37240 [Nitrospirales bacterium]